MTPEQAAAYVNAQTALFLAELEGMKAENALSAHYQESPPYGHDQFVALNKRWQTVLGHNAVIALFQEANR